MASNPRRGFVCLKQENSLFQDIVQLIVVFFAAEFVVCFIVCISLFWWSCIEAPLCNTIVLNVKHVFKRNLTCLNQLLNCFLPIIFYHVPPIFIESESICFGAPTLMSPIFSDNGKDVLINNLHAMGRICKELWTWDFLIKISFRFLS